MFPRERRNFADLAPARAAAAGETPREPEPEGVIVDTAAGRDDAEVRILVTGGTGLVGSHIVVALLSAGHDVRLLVRRAEQVEATFAPHGVTVGDVVVGDVVVGDVLDEATVVAALDGCDAVVHAAAVFSFDPRRADEMLRTNARAATLVLEGAVDRGCDPIVHISSTVALVRHGTENPDLDLGDVDLPYCHSKIASEEVARALQELGAPVVTVYPGAVYGPFDPYDGEQGRRLRWIVKGLFPIWPTRGMHVVDVRDVAAVVVAVMVPGAGARRYFVPGHHMSGRDLFGAVSAATGRRRPHLPLPPRLAVMSTAAIDAVQKRLPARWRYPADREATEVLVRDTHFDDSPARRELGVEPRPVEETVRDTIRWMVDAGRLPEKYGSAG